MNLPTIIEQLQALEAQVQTIARAIRPHVPDKADPMTDPLLEAYNRTGGAAAELARAARAVKRGQG